MWEAAAAAGGSSMKPGCPSGDSGVAALRVGVWLALQLGERRTVEAGSGVRGRGEGEKGEDVLRGEARVVVVEVRRANGRGREEAGSAAAVQLLLLQRQA